jgi:hypothetical protein
VQSAKVSKCERLHYGVASIKFQGIERESKQKKVMTKLYVEALLCRPEEK